MNDLFECYGWPAPDSRDQARVEIERDFAALMTAAGNFETSMKHAGQLLTIEEARTAWRAIWALLRAIQVSTPGRGVPEPKGVRHVN